MNQSAETKHSGKALKHLRKIGLLLLVPLLLVPGQVFAQPTGNCPATMSLDFAGSSGPFELGQEIPIKLTLGMEYTPGSPRVNIDHFQYLLDCEPGLGLPFPGCTPQGNGVSFIGPAQTTCTDDAGATPLTLVSVENGAVTIDFYVDNGGGGVPPSNAAIEIQSPGVPGPPNTCEVTFDVSVDSLAVPNSTDPLYEYSFWSTTDAQCDNDTSSEQLANLTIPISNPNVVFWVTKDFTDDNKSPVDVHIRCDAGIQTIRDFTIRDPAAGEIFDRVGFVVYGIPSVGANCRIYEGPVPDGYVDDYSASFTEGAVFDGLDAIEGEGCFFEAVQGGEYFCEVTNTPEPGMFTVHKEWVIPNPGGDEVNKLVEVTITCDSEIEEVVPEPELVPDSVSHLDAAGKSRASPLIVDNTYEVKGILGDGDSLTVMVDTTNGPAECEAEEEVQESGVESTDDCGIRTIPAGGESECTFVNTVFFEGIPTLSQYGMALLAMLMLGLGAVGLRKFA